VILFGLSSMANGIYQIATGRQSRMFTIATLAIAGLLLLYVFGFELAFD
jgi:hypothetical protein